MSSRPVFRLFSIAFVVLAFVVGLRGDEVPPGVLAFTIVAPEGKLSTKEVHDVVVTAATDLGWSLKDDTNEKVVIYINKRKHEATVTFLISDKQVETYCEGFATDGNGNRKGPEQPSGWLKNLNGAITKGLGKAALPDRK